MLWESLLPKIVSTFTQISANLFKASKRSISKEQGVPFAFENRRSSPVACICEKSIVADVKRTRTGKCVTVPLMLAPVTAVLRISFLECSQNGYAMILVLL